MRRHFRPTTLIVATGLLSALVLAAQTLPGSGPRLPRPGYDQEAIAAGEVSLPQLRERGLLVFTTPFNKADGYGDGPMNPVDPRSPGGRPTLQNNGTFLRVNGLDGQSCLECHSIVSNASVPARFGVGGVGGAVSNAMFMPSRIDVGDELGEGSASFDGRFINPPFLFGAGGVELVGKEMTRELQALAALALSQPGVDVPLVTKGVSFGTVRAVSGTLDTSNVQGIDADLVVRPFGRKGEFPTLRSFDLVALPFHFGMQPVETVGPGIDDDGDGVVDEVETGDLSALSIFATTLPPPSRDGGRRTRSGARLFRTTGCASCHVPELVTESRVLDYSFPVVPADPDANVYYSVDLAAIAGFPTRGKGLAIPLFADLKRHDMGAGLAESFDGAIDHMFTTARLWGVADTAPYLHDGRATTLEEAILLHGGEAQAVRDTFAALPPREQADLIAFLMSLRTPSDPLAGLAAESRDIRR